MGDHTPSPCSSSSSAVAGRRGRRNSAASEAAEEAEEEDPVSCTGKSCQSCTAGVIADCVAVCCCPCAVVNILTLAFVKLPWAVARRCLDRRKRRRRRRMLEEKRGRDVISENERMFSCEELNDHFSAEFNCEDVWLEVYEVEHLGFGRVSFSGIPFQDKGD